MIITYDICEGEFLSKIIEFEYLQMPPEDRTNILDGFLKRAIVSFNKVCKYDLSSFDDENRQFNENFVSEDVEEIVDILSDGMIIQWLKPYLYRQELLESVLNTKDFTTYSTAELLLRIKETYQQTQKAYVQKLREYSYNHGNLTELHL